MSFPDRIGPILKRLRPLLVVIMFAAVAFALHSSGTVRKAADAVMPSATPTPADPKFERFKGACKSHLPAYEDSGFKGAERVAVFGQPNDEQNFLTVDFFGYAVIVHYKVAPCLSAVERELKAQNTTYEVSEIGSYREEREDRPYWYHQYGAAIDINPSENPQCLAKGEGRDPNAEGLDIAGLCNTAKPYALPPEWITAFKRYGFVWGGDFDKGKDYMHFEWHGEAPPE